MTNDSKSWPGTTALAPVPYDVVIFSKFTMGMFLLSINGCYRLESNKVSP